VLPSSNPYSLDIVVLIVNSYIVSLFDHNNEPASVGLVVR
jgi:hypothetical protein